MANSPTKIGRLRSDSMDDRVHDWLGAIPDELRLSVAALFLWGYWPFVDRIFKPLTERLAQAAVHLPKHLSVYGYTLLALMAAYTTQKSNISEHELRVGRKLLHGERQILRETGLHPGILDILDDLH